MAPKRIDLFDAMEKLSDDHIITTAVLDKGPYGDPLEIRAKVGSHARVYGLAEFLCDHVGKNCLLIIQPLDDEDTLPEMGRSPILSILLHTARRLEREGKVVADAHRLLEDMDKQIEAKQKRLEMPEEPEVADLFSTLQEGDKISLVGPDGMRITCVVVSPDTDREQWQTDGVVDVESALGLKLTLTREAINATATYRIPEDTNEAIEESNETEVGEGEVDPGTGQVDEAAGGDPQASNGADGEGASGGSSASPVISADPDPAAEELEEVAPGGDATGLDFKPELFDTIKHKRATQRYVVTDTNSDGIEMEPVEGGAKVDLTWKQVQDFEKVTT